MRVSTRLPCQWQIFDARPTQHELRTRFGLQQDGEYVAELDRLSDSIDSAIRAVTDPAVRDALALLNNKVDVCARARTARRVPAEQPIELSLSPREPMAC